MPGLSQSELESFLDEPGHLLRLGTVGSDGLPRVVPIWFIHRNGSGWHIHDWDSHQGALLERRARDRDNARARRRKETTE